MNRIVGIDTIRAMMATWVMFNHLGTPPIFDLVDTRIPFFQYLKYCYNVSVNGQAAVIVFFVISGFCVYYPYRRGELFSAGNFYARRHIRVAVPLAVSVIATQFLPEGWRNLQNGIFWSVYAELIYYSLFPIFLRLSRRFGWLPMIIASSLLAPSTLIVDHPGGNYHAMGANLAWILGLPCWLIGCLLAEKFNKHSFLVSDRTIWAWRVGIWLISCFIYFLRFHTPIKHYHSLNFFAVAVFFWLVFELHYYKNQRPSKMMEWAGGWSYSLYLTHFFSWYIWSEIFNIREISLLNWPLRLLFVYLFAYAFYWVVEAPSHRFARWLAPSKPLPPPGIVQMVVNSPQISSQPSV